MNIKKLTILSILALSVFTLVPLNKAYADNSGCTPNYGGGETCLVNKRFKIKKEVRLEGDNEWKDEVTVNLNDKDEVGKFVEFRITIENLSDDADDINFDNMKMKDTLPDELLRIGGDGLTEYWNDFEPGDVKEFKIKVQIDDEEIKKDGQFEKCVVNKAELYWDDEFEGSDTATVCWENVEVTELPKTGSVNYLTLLLGSALVLSGTFIRVTKKLYATA